MSPPVISISNLTKRYRIFDRPVERLRDALGLAAKYKEFNALEDVSFDIRQGEFWGILGKNGSGKSTLLKIVAGLAQPTSGSVATSGKVALLQLGLGFDAEQTGLENIRQSRLVQNLASDYDEVVEFIKDFSELGDFINYPVKTYSSGMHSRLAFATAIAGAPDILIADEVLAVGDMSFSQKCLAKMREFKEQGKTIVLVTHDINAVRSFCDHGVWLNEGKRVAIGDAKAVAEDFRNFMLYGVLTPQHSSHEAEARSETAPDGSESHEPAWIVPKTSRRTISTGQVELLSYRFTSRVTGETLTTLPAGEPITFEIRFRTAEPIALHSFGFTLHDRHGMIAVHLNSGFFGQTATDAPAGREGVARFQFDVPMLASGDYSISFGCSVGNEEGELVEKYDHDSIFTIAVPADPITESQGGYIVVPAGTFEYADHA